MTLYILGNGFDLHHKLNTSLSDYAKYLKKHNNSLYEKLSLCLPLNRNWSNFEESFSQIKIMTALSELDDTLPDADNERSGLEWIYYDQAENFIKQFTIDVQNTMNDWILSLDYSQLKRSSYVTFDKNCKILSFNYSKTVEYLYNPKGSLLHIHNLAKKREKYRYKPDEVDLGLPEEENSDIIIGHSPVISSQQYIMNPRYDSYQNMLRSINFDTLSNLITLTTKNAAEIIQANATSFCNLNKIDKVVVYGHSLGDCDIPYFETVLKNIQPTANFEFYYYSTEDLNTIKVFSSKYLDNRNTNYVRW